MPRKILLLLGLLLGMAGHVACSGTTTGGTGGAVAGYATCTTDDQCAPNQGCTLDAPQGDGYCTALCDDDNQCPPKYSCPSLVQDRPADCDEQGRHRGRGICEMFGSEYGPNTCGTAKPGGTLADAGGGGG